MRPGVQTTISAPFFISAIWSLIGEPPYAQTAYRMPGQPERLGDARQTYPEIEDLQEGLTFSVDLSGQLSSRGHDDGHGALHLFQRALVFDVSEEGK